MSDECERVLFGFHCRKLGLNITYRRSESLQGILKAINTDLMNLIFTKKIGTLLLAIYLIVIGLSTIAALAISGVITGILALAAGIFILIGR